MVKEEEYMPEANKPDAFGRKMRIVINEGFHHMHNAVSALRAAVLATAVSDLSQNDNPILRRAFEKEKEAMYMGVYQPEEDETLADMQRKVTNSKIAAKKKVNWFQRVYSEKIIGHKLSFHFVFDELVNKFSVSISYRPNGGILEVCTNGRHSGREKRIADMLSMSFNDEDIPYTLTFEDTIM